MTFFKMGTDFDVPTLTKNKNECRGLISVLLCPCCEHEVNYHEHNMRGLGVYMAGLDMSVWTVNCKYTIDR